MVVQLFRNPRASVRFRPRARARVRPTGEAAAFQAAPGELDSRCPLGSRRSPGALITSCSSSGRGIRVLNPATRVRFPYTTRCKSRLRRLTDQDLRLRISGWWFESTRSREHGLGSGITLASKPDEWGSIPQRPAVMTRQADHLAVMPVSYADRAGFDSLACYEVFIEVWLNLVRARGSGPRDWWFKSTHLDKFRHKDRAVAPTPNGNASATRGGVVPRAR
jgi:hypothetical protein